MSTVYVVTDTSGKESDRLVNAISNSAALRHVTKQRYVAKAATPIAVAQLMAAGVKLERANSEDEALEASERR